MAASNVASKNYSELHKVLKNPSELFFGEYYAFLLKKFTQFVNFTPPTPVLACTGSGRPYRGQAVRIKN
jgi:hypothetical protein